MNSRPLKLPSHELEPPFHRSGARVVCRGHRLADDRPVIVKATRSASLRPQDVAALRHEHGLLSLVDSPHVPHALGFEYEPGQHAALIIEDIGAPGSLELLAREPVSLELVIELGIQAATALEAIHQLGIIHYDVKLQNLVYAPERGLLQLIDFGLAMRLANESPERLGHGQVVGTLPYLSPEQTGHMNCSVDHRSDLYSLGVVLYRLLTGELPFEAEDAAGFIHCHVALEPIPAHARAPSVPTQLSAIVARLMDKDRERRYQSAAGLAADLRRCAERRRGATIEAFELGEDDRSSVFRLADKLYGREVQIAELLGAHTQLRESSGPPRQVLLIHGVPGVGKSSLIRELHKPLIASRGLMAAGKFDLLQRATPLAGLLEAFADLVAQLLREPPARLDARRRALLDALGHNGRVLTELLPELELLLGPQPGLAPLEGQGRLHRLQHAFESFVVALCSRARPLILVVDDLQWIDAGSLMLLEHVLSSPTVEGLLVLGAYRSNEVDGAHPLRAALDRIAAAVPVHNVELQPLVHEDVVALLVDSLGADAVATRELARVVIDKTGGNPFFVRQFLATLHERSLLEFDHQRRRWIWDVAAIESRQLTDNVASLVVQRLEALPAQAQALLRVAGCIGARFDLMTLASVAERSPAETFASLWPALEQQMLIPEAATRALLRSPDPQLELSPEDAAALSLRFGHDRVQQGVAASSSDEGRARAHLAIGRVLRRRLDAAAPTKFEVADQLNAGRSLIHDPDERLALIELDLDCGRAAIRAAAYDSAVDYLELAAALLPEEIEQGLWFAVQLERVRAYNLVSRYSDSATLYSLLLERAPDDAARYAVACEKVDQAMLSSDGVFGVEALREAFALRGITLPEGEDDGGPMVAAELAAIEAKLAGIDIAALKDAPAMTDAEQLSLLSLLGKGGALAYLGGKQTVQAWIIARATNTALDHGSGGQSALAYSTYGYLMSALGNHERAQAFAQLALDMTLEARDTVVYGRVHYTYYAVVGFQVMPLRELLAPLYRAFPVCLEGGDITYGSYMLLLADMFKLASGAPLADVVLEIDRHLPFMIRSIPSTLAMFYLPSVVVLAAELVGLPLSRFGVEFDPAVYLETFANVEISKATYYAARFRIDCFLDAAVELDEIVERVAVVERGVTGQFYICEARYYAILLALALARSSATVDQATHASSQVIEGHVEGWYAQFPIWEERCPANYAHMRHLIDAERGRNAGHAIEAVMADYEAAIAAARKHGFIDQEGLANRLYGDFWRERGSPRLSDVCLEAALRLYHQWGATRVATELEAAYPHLGSVVSVQERGGSSSSSSSLHPTSNRMSIRGSGSSSPGGTQLTFDAINRAARAIARAPSLDAMLVELAGILLRSLGAQRCLILLPEGDLWRVASAAPERDEGEFPEAVVQFAGRTREVVVLTDAAVDSRWSSDPHVAARGPKSVLSAPVMLHDQLLAMVYAENNLATGVFTAEAIARLHIVLSQAAVVLEKERLFGVLRSQEEQLRRSQKMDAVGTLAGGIAHDFNNLLTVILGASELGLMDAEEGSEAHDLFEEIAAASWRAEGLARQLLTFSRKQVARPEFVDLNAIIEGLRDMFPRLLGEQVELVIEADDGPCHAHVDPGQFEQVLVNLVVNAGAAMQRSGRLTIATRHDRSGAIPAVVVSVSDTGEGMDAETLSHIYEPFFTTKETGQGTGLGLAMVHGIVTQHDGRIEVDSILGEGTTFHIHLPERVAAEFTSEDQRDASLPRGDETILLVEDDKQVRALAASVLARLGYEVVTAADGQTGLLLVRDTAVDLVLSDVVMPRMTGPELAAALIVERPELPVLYMSGYADAAMVRHGLDPNLVTVLLKPFSVATLACAVRVALDER